MDYRQEKEKLVDKSEYLKLKEGSHTVLFLGEGIEVTRTFKNDVGVDEVTQRMQFPVEVKKELSTWEMSISTAKASCYGQLMVIGAKANTLIGKFINVIVQGTGKSKRYIIPEALEENKSINEEIVA